MRSPSDESKSIAGIAFAVGVLVGAFLVCIAVAAYYLADACSDEGIGNGQAIKRLGEEFRCLAGQVIDPAQAKRAERALAGLEGGAA
jgi:hypothetical protein